MTERDRTSGKSESPSYTGAPVDLYVPGELLVRFTSNLPQQAAEAALAAVGGRIVERLGGGADGSGYFAARIAIGQGLSVDQAITILSNRPGIQVAEPNWTANINLTSNDPYYVNGSLWGMNGTSTPLTNGFGSQAGEAWTVGAVGSKNTIVGVIDTGVDYTHPDLYLNIWLNQGEIRSLSFFSSLVDADQDGSITFRDLNARNANNQLINSQYVTDVNSNGYIDAGDLLKDRRWADLIDNDGNSRIDDLIGWDFVNNDNDPFDDNGHGTHVSGTIGALGGNGIGVAGVVWQTQIIALKFLGASGSGSISGAIQAVNYFASATTFAQTMGLSSDFVATNNSWGGGGSSQTMLDAIVRGANAGNLFVAAAGNGGADGIGDNNDATPNYPSNYSTQTAIGWDAVIAVAAINSSGARASYSNYGNLTVDLAAPGSGILSTVPNNGYASYSGTSMATPHVTGALALLASVSPTSTPQQLITMLRQAVTPVSSLATLTAWDGVLNIGDVVAGIINNPVDTTAPTLAITLSRSTLTAGQTATVTFTFSENVSGFTQPDISLADANGSLSGFVAINGATYQAIFTPLNNLSDTTNTLSVANGAYSDVVGNAGQSATSASYAINTVAVPPPSGGQTFYGTAGSETIRGTAYNDIIYGVPATGTSPGLGSVDTLFGGAGADIFMLGDIRGYFYDDGNAKNAGKGDYAILADFVSGQDKISVGALYFTGATTINGTKGLGIYGDTNRNGSYNPTSDELIGFVLNYSSLPATDFVTALAINSGPLSGLM